MVILARTSGERKQNGEDFRQKQLDFIRRYKISELSRYTYVSGPTEGCIGDRTASVSEL